MAFEPKILSFNCNWCSYAAADTAGTARIQYPHNIRIIRVMCSGMVHPNHVVDAFRLGADGVMVTGCHLGECHYVDGNTKAQARVAIVEEMLDALGLERDRFRLVWCSLAEPDRFVTAVREMTESVRSLGASPYRMVPVPEGAMAEDIQCPSP